jgi:hypothetical protein
VAQARRRLLATQMGHLPHAPAWRARSRRWPESSDGGGSSPFLPPPREPARRQAPLALAANHASALLPPPSVARPCLCLRTTAGVPCGALTFKRSPRSRRRRICSGVARFLAPQLADCQIVPSSPTHRPPDLLWDAVAPSACGSPRPERMQ